MMMLAKRVVFVVILLNIQVMFVIAFVKSEELTSAIRQVKEQSMTNNFKNLNDARDSIKKYEASNKASGWLSDAKVSLIMVNLTIEKNITVRHQVRDSKLLLLLQVLALLDRDINSNFDWKHAPEPIMGSFVTDDPEFRAKCDKKIKENNALADYAYRQRGLNLVNKDFSEITKSFIQSAYTTSPPDQLFLRTSIEKIITNQKRKKELLELLPTLHDALIGATARTGERCPETGMWHANNTHPDVIYSMTMKRFLQRNSTMPVYSSDIWVTWKLVSYEKSEEA
jgi:hypothetical protein